MFKFRSLFFFLATGGGDTSGASLQPILNIAGDLLTWLFSQMGSLLTFMMSNPLVLTPFVIVLAGLVVGYFGRIWGSVR